MAAAVMMWRMNDVRVRPLSRADRPAWHPLWLAYLEFYGENLSGDVTDATWARLVGDDASCGGLAAVGGDELVGFLHYLVHPTTWDTRPACYLEDLFVVPSRRGTGAGRALIEALAGVGSVRHWTQIHWTTAADNLVAQRLYDRIARRTDWVRYELDVED
ncbi:MAG: GNAT family N-acetyltransferase [Nitriliruptorales bacterium]|nr:GNAT family N-acetyltransferase [Nitriliruptorales bacterium]